MSLPLGYPTSFVESSFASCAGGWSQPPRHRSQFRVSIDHGAILEARTDPKRRHEVDEEAEEEEEEGRPPYLHVRGCVVSNRYSIAAYLTDHAVDVGWWNRRHDWRSLDALDRYSQNAATGRHPHSPKYPTLSSAYATIVRQKVSGEVCIAESHRLSWDLFLGPSSSARTNTVNAT
jgi:hypothetical protein